MANIDNNLMLSANAFSKCAPNISTNIRECGGTVTQCSPKPLTLDDLEGVYGKSGDYRIMEHLLHADMEIAMCDVVREDLSDFFMANAMPMKARVDSDNPEITRVAPFIKAKRYSALNNLYWAVSNGQTNGGNWQVDAASVSSIPPDVRSFPVGMRVYIQGRTGGGTETHTSWTVVSSTLINNAVRVVLASGNAGSNMPSAALASPVTGVLSRGTARVYDSEKYCAEPPAYLTANMTPFWLETTRLTMCTSSVYEKVRATLLTNNALYREWGDLDSVEKNKQIGQDFKRGLMQNMFWGKPISTKQNIHDYDELDDVTSYGGGAFSVGGGICKGKAANMVGLYEQMYECGRVYDAGGATLNLIAVFNELYNIMRIREASGKKPHSFDLFTDSRTADVIMEAMLDYYNAKQPSGSNMYHINVDVNQPYKDGEFGFRWRSFKISYPNGITINIVTHNYFDDLLSAYGSAGFSATTGGGRRLWILDMAGMQPGIVATNHVENNTGDLKALAAIDSSWACVMEVDTTKTSLTSTTMTFMVKCPAASLLIENFSSTKPVVTAPGALVYPATTTTTTTTSS